MYGWKANVMRLENELKVYACYYHVFGYHPRAFVYFSVVPQSRHGRCAVLRFDIVQVRPSSATTCAFQPGVNHQGMCQQAVVSTDQIVYKM